MEVRLHAFSDRVVGSRCRMVRVVDTPGVQGVPHRCSSVQRRSPRTHRYHLESAQGSIYVSYNLSLVFPLYFTTFEKWSRIGWNRIYSVSCESFNYLKILFCRTQNKIERQMDSRFTYRCFILYVTFISVL